MAGSTLAARLGAAGLRVLLLERTLLPSLPPVSSPAIYSSTMKLLDEIGAEEADYARNTPRVRRWVTEAGDAFRTINYIPDLHGRDYGYAIDRGRFDEALWRNAARFPTVTALQGFVVTDLLREGDRVCGVTGHTLTQERCTFSADCVVGADGRFSLVARQVGARVFAEHTAQPTTLYYAYWKNAEPYDEHGPAIHLYGLGQGYGFLLMDSADDTLGVVIEGQSALLDPGEEGAEALYLRLLREQPRLWRRLARAEQSTEVRGMKKVGNLYRAGGGPGWALVGDALHQKDPLDGQGIYDAVFTAKVLAEAILAWKQKGTSWAQAAADYEAAVYAETYPMYIATLERVVRDIYTYHTPFSWKTMIRWIAADPEYKRRLALLIVRGIDPAEWLPSSVVSRAIVRGAVEDLRRFLRRQPDPAALPPLES